jgi:hypothetical protein
VSTFVFAFTLILSFVVVVVVVFVVVIVAAGKMTRIIDANILERQWVLILIFLGDISATVNDGGASQTSLFSPFGGPSWASSERRFRAAG